MLNSYVLAVVFGTIIMCSLASQAGETKVRYKVHGKFRGLVCNPDIFEKSYEPVERSSDESPKS